MAGYNTYAGILSEEHYWEGVPIPRFFIYVDGVKFMTFDKDLYSAAQKLVGKKVTIEYFSTSFDPRVVSITEVTDVVAAI